MPGLGEQPDNNAPSFNKGSVNIPSWSKIAFRSVSATTQSAINLHPNCVGVTLKVLPTLVDGVTANNPLIISLKSGEVAKVAGGLVGGEQLDILFPGDIVSFSADRLRNSNPNPGEGRGAGPERLQEGPAQLYTAIIEVSANAAQLGGGGSPDQSVAYRGASGAGVGDPDFAAEAILSVAAGPVAGQSVITFDNTPSITAFIDGMVLDITGSIIYDGRWEVVATDDAADTITVVMSFKNTRTGTGLLSLPGDDDGLGGTSATHHCEFILIQELHALADQVTREDY